MANPLRTIDGLFHLFYVPFSMIVRYVFMDESETNRSSP